VNSNENGPAVSVIVAVYNAEGYLARCMDSLIGQKFTDMEIVVVNDGSTDGSQNIIDRYQRDYPATVTAIAQENQGTGATRNKGITHARGRYIGFVDCDDWVAPDMYEKMYAQAVTDESDIVMCDITQVYEGTKETEYLAGYRGQKPNPCCVSDFVMDSLNSAFAWNKIYKRELFKEIKFIETWYEDVGTLPLLVSFSNKISYMPTPLYFYVKRENSRTEDGTNPRNAELITAWENCIQHANKAYEWEMAYSVYRSVAANILHFDPPARDLFIRFLTDNRRYFETNDYARQALELGDALELLESSITHHGKCRDMLSETQHHHAICRELLHASEAQCRNLNEKLADAEARLKEVQERKPKRWSL